MDSLFSVANQIVLVSGGTRGIGFAIAEGFAERGATVIVTGRTAEGAAEAADKLCPAQPFRPLGLACDVPMRDQVKRLASEPSSTSSAASIRSSTSPASTAASRPSK